MHNKWCEKILGTLRALYAQEREELQFDIKVADHPRGLRKHCVISVYIFNKKSRVRLGTK